jgi:hypothetical protein
MFTLSGAAAAALSQVKAIPAGLTPVNMVPGAPVRLKRTPSNRVQRDVHALAPLAIGQLHVASGGRRSRGLLRLRPGAGALFPCLPPDARALDATVIVFQCPASFTPTAAHARNLRAFFRAIAGEAAGFRLCWEPRGEWDRKALLDLCAELDLVLAVDPFASEPPPAGWRYYRLHGVGGYRYTYSDEDLRRLRNWCGGETYCLFNNMAMASDAQRFEKLLTRPGKP